MLTGESVPWTTSSVAPDLALGNRTSMLFSGTLVAAGAIETRNTCTYCSVACGIILYAKRDAKTGKPNIYHIEGDSGHPDQPRNALFERCRAARYGAFQNAHALSAGPYIC